MKAFFNFNSGRFNGLLRTPLTLRSRKRFLTKCYISLTQALSSLVLVAFIFSVSSCSKDTPQKEFERNFVLKVIYDQSTKQKTTSLQACIDSYNSAQVCLATATGFPIYPLTEGILAGTLSRNTVSTYQDICQSTLASLKNELSESMMICNFNCNKSYFNTRNSLNTCTGSFLQIFTDLETDSGTKRCRIDCTKTTNN